MSNLVYDGANGLFTRLGTLIYMMDAVRAHQNNLKTLLANVQAEYSSADAYMIERLSGNIDARIAEAGNILLDVQESSLRTLLEMCFNSATDSGSTIPMKSKTAYDALVWLIRAMRQDTETVERQPITKASLAVGASNSGNGTFTYQFATPAILLDGNAEWENTRSEVVQVRCVSDAQDGAIAKGSEVFTIEGQPYYPPLDYRFPAGSGTRMQMTSVCASVDAGPRFANILTNSDFEDFTSNVPDGFTVSSGTAGTDFGPNTTNVYRGTRSLDCKATGATFKLRQQFGIGTGTYAALIPDRPYLICAAIRRGTSATGTIEISVEDGSGNVINSGAFKLTCDVTTASGTFGLFTSTVRSPRIIPTATYLVVETTAAIATAACQVDEIVLAEMQQLGNGGPYLSIVAGATDWKIDDTARYQFTNTGDAKVQQAFDRLFDMYAHGLLLPSDATPTIADSVIA
jgi:hypothetical protein